MQQGYQRKRRRPVAEINVVPYIDVMLVLLIIFMVTAPIVTQGVKVDLLKLNLKPCLRTVNLRLSLPSMLMGLIFSMLAVQALVRRWILKR